MFLKKIKTNILKLTGSNFFLIRTSNFNGRLSHKLNYKVLQLQVLKNVKGQRRQNILEIV